MADAVITPDSANKVLANLDNIYDGEESFIRDQWYAPFSGQPDADLGALNITYDTGTKGLNDTLADTIAGNKPTSHWLSLANDTEQSMRAIAKYTAQASATAEVEYVVTQTEKDVQQVVQKAADETGKGVWSIIVAAFKGSPILVVSIFIILLAVLFVIFTPGIRAAQSVAGAANE